MDRETTINRILKLKRKPIKGSDDAHFIMELLENLGYSPFICFANWSWTEIKKTINDPNSNR